MLRQSSTLWGLLAEEDYISKYEHRVEVARMVITQNLEPSTPVSLLSNLPEYKANGTFDEQFGDTVTIITWIAYSPLKQSGTITISQWGFLDETEQVILKSLGIYSISKAAWERSINPETLLPNSHKRIACQYGRTRYKKQRFRGLLIIPMVIEILDHLDMLRYNRRRGGM